MNHIKTDVLIVGVGLAGMVAAISAAKSGKKITVEVDNLKQLKKILGLKFDRVLFDNMNLKNLRKGVKIAKKYYETEASGNMNFKSIKSVASTGVDRISIGSLTHSASGIDFKLEI